MIVANTSEGENIRRQFDTTPVKPGLEVNLTELKPK